MGEIDKLQPAYRIPPARPAAGRERDQRPPRRKSERNDDTGNKPGGRRGDDKSRGHIDEYA